MKNQIFNINSKDELQDVINKMNDNVLIIDFTSPICPPCLMLEPVMEELVDKNLCSVARINTLENDELVEEFGIRATPTIVIVKNKEIKKSVLGYQPVEAWIEMLKQI